MKVSFPEIKLTLNLHSLPTPAGCIEVRCLVLEETIQANFDHGKMLLVGKTGSDGNQLL
jgi:hypothetical protein